AQPSCLKERRLKNSYNRFMARRAAFAISLIAAILCACQTVPYTGRHHLMLVSQGEEKQLGAQAYQETLKKSKLSTDQDKIAILRRVGHRLARDADKPDYQWEFNLIQEDKTINAWCL